MQAIFALVVRNVLNDYTLFKHCVLPSRILGFFVTTVTENAVHELLF